MGRRHAAWVIVRLLLLPGCALVSSLGLGDSAPDPGVAASAPPAPPPRSAPPGDVASWYGAWHHGRPTASGEPFDMEALTAAHRSLPLGLCVEVVHLRNGRRVFVRVNDRGPYVDGRTLDLSYRAAQELEMVDAGLAGVSIRQVTAEACEGSERA